MISLKIKALRACFIVFNWLSEIERTDWNSAWSESNRRGSTFNITGKLDHTRLAAQLIENFYIRAKKPIELEDIQLGLVEIDKLSPEDVTTTFMKN